MEALLLAAVVGATLIILLMIGIPVAFSLGITAMIFIAYDEGFGGFPSSSLEHLVNHIAKEFHIFHFRNQILVETEFAIFCAFLFCAFST